MFTKDSRNPIRLGLCSPETPLRIRVLRTFPTGAEADELSTPDRPTVKYGSMTVPELWYELAPEVGATVTISGQVCESLRVHCNERYSRGCEVGGIVVGCQWRTSNSAGMLLNVLATDVIAIQALDSSRCHLSFGEVEWSDAERELVRRYAPQGKVKVGWYHTHPHQGIFFSAQDEAAHRMFRLAYQFALVVDPRFMEAGLFYWSGAKRRTLEGPIRFVLGRDRK
jgi:proteasome lid subunit RPN8/RPN11